MRSADLIIGPVARLFRTLITQQHTLSTAFDRLLPAWVQVDGNRDFVDSFVPQFLRPGMTVFDVGGGKSPFVSAEQKAQMGLRVIGLDIDAGELARAPHGAYDEVVCADICTYVGTQTADVVICQALLEHVPDVESALRSLASIVKPGGHVLVFVPSRRAVFARLNLVLPEGFKRGVLFAIWPQTAAKQGFRAFYDRCTPHDFRELTSRSGLVIGSERHYFSSAYFKCCFPLHVLWRLWMAVFFLARGNEAAETFVVAIRRPLESAASAS
jgi:SAM-dependent methyltransferase